MEDFEVHPTGTKNAIEYAQSDLRLILDTYAPSTLAHACAERALEKLEKCREENS